MGASLYALQPLSEFIEGFDAGVSVNSDDRPSAPGEHGVLKVSAVTIGRFVPGENKAIVERDIDRMGPCVRRGDLLVTRANTHELVGAAALVPADFPFLHLSDKTWRARLRSLDNGTKRWLAHVLTSRAVRSELRRRASGTSGSMKNISQQAYLRIRVASPPQEMRARMADVLDSVGKYQTTLHALLNDKRVFRRGMVGDVLTGKRRIVDRGLNWMSTSLGRVLTESRESASNGSRARKLTVRLYGRGVVSKRDSRPGSANTQYYRRRRGQLIYSKLDFLNGAFGIIPPELDGYESTLDLPAFNVLPEVNARWLLQLFSWPGFYERQVRLANGGRKARRVNPKELLKLEVVIPTREEQDAIAGLLDGLDREIALLEELTMLVERQRQALLENLLSGELRLPVR